VNDSLASGDRAGFPPPVMRRLGIKREHIRYQANPGGDVMVLVWEGLEQDHARLYWVANSLRFTSASLSSWRFEFVDGDAVDIVCQTTGQSVSGKDGSSSDVWDKPLRVITTQPFNGSPPASSG
jgi:hypothetical protein